MSTEIKMYYDYVCPFCYLAEFALEQLLKNHRLEDQVTVTPIPFELRRPPTPKTDPMHDPAKLERFEKVLSPEANRLGIEMKLPEISPHPYTTLTFQGYHFAADAGKGDAYNKAVFAAFYQQEKDIGELPVIREILKELGLDAGAFEKAAAENRYLDRLDQQKQQAVDEGVASLPTFIIGNRQLTGLFEPEEMIAAIQDAQTAAVSEGMCCTPDGCHG